MEQGWERQAGEKREKGRERGGEEGGLGEESKGVEKREAAERKKQILSQNIEMPHFVLKFLERGNHTEI